MIAPNSAANEYLATVGGIPKMTLPGGEEIERPHREWLLYQLRWRWLLDSWEGGEAYRLATYGIDVRGMPVRNLIRHKREYPSSSPTDNGSWSQQTGRPAGTDMGSQATDDDYELRRARTPVPTFVPDAVKRHLGKIYTREIDREVPENLAEWMKDVTGQGEGIDQWMSLTFAPLFMVLGHLDVLIEPPAVPEGDQVQSRADEIRLKLHTAVISHILPENLPWWELNRDRTYRRLVVREVAENGTLKYRYWDAQVWQLYKADGKPEAGGPVEHGYGIVPIIRIHDRRRPREPHIGLPRYEPLAEIQREYYNRDSELILSDTTHAHPLLQGPEDYVQPDGTIPIGPNWLLPEKKYLSGSGTAYRGFSVITFPHEGADSIRLNKADLRDSADRAALLMKPAGAQGTTGETVGQSGVSKRLDVGEGADLLAEIAKSLQGAELRICELALRILRQPIERSKLADTVKITYPAEFNLMSAEELLAAAVQWQAALQGAGATPEIDASLLSKIARTLLPGLSDETYKTFDEEIEAHLEAQQVKLAQAREAQPPADEQIPGEAGADGEQPPEQNPAETESTERESTGNSVGARTQ
jgi:hypothetical protein